jgi:predicted Na+-dependent transporter
MNEYFVILIFIAWYTLSLIVSERIGKRRKMGVQWSFFICILLSPLIGYVITYFSSRRLNVKK